MVIIKATQLGFSPNSNHTVGYARSACNFINGGSTNAEGNFYEDATTSELSGTFQLVVAEDFTKGIEIMRAQIADYLSGISWLNANLDDFFFTEAHSDIENNLCWQPNGTYCHIYRVSDLKIL